jgi:hypothetical protein
VRFRGAQCAAWPAVKARPSHKQTNKKPGMTRRGGGGGVGVPRRGDAPERGGSGSERKGKGGNRGKGRTEGRSLEPARGAFEKRIAYQSLPAEPGAQPSVHQSPRPFLLSLAVVSNPINYTVHGVANDVGYYKPSHLRSEPLPVRTAERHLDSPPLRERDAVGLLRCTCAVRGGLRVQEQSADGSCARHARATPGALFVCRCRHQPPPRRNSVHRACAPA